MADAEIIQLGSRGVAGRGSRKAPSAAARGLAGPRTVRAAASEPEVTEPEVSESEATVSQDDANPFGALRQAQGAENPPPDDTAYDDSTHDGPAPGPSLSSLLGELPGLAANALAGLRGAGSSSWRRFADDPARVLLSVAEALGVDGQAAAGEIREYLRSRIEADYTVDEFGFDAEFTAKVFLPLLRPLVRSWFRVEVRGTENLPTDGPALLVSNHAGTMPLDGMVLHAVVHDEIGRHVRMLGADLIFATPFSHDLARKTGTTLACQEDAERLLKAGELVSVFPEGFKGLGKRYADRYKLQRFGRGGFVSAAVRAQVPIIPVSIVGSEEIYPLLSRAPALARALGLPYFPVTPLFPWLGPLGMVPLPSKWVIQIGEAITTDELAPGAAEDPMVVFNVTDQVRETIQHTLYALLMQRRSAFF